MLPPGQKHLQVDKAEVVGRERMRFLVWGNCIVFPESLGHGPSTPAWVRTEG